MTSSADLLPRQQVGDPLSEQPACRTSLADNTGAAAPRAAATRLLLSTSPNATTCIGHIDRAQLLAAAERADHRLGQIGDPLTEVARENVLTGMVTAQNVAGEWDQMNRSWQRAVIKNLMTITLHTLGCGFALITITIDGSNTTIPTTRPDG